MTELETERLILRLPERRDLDGYAPIFGDSTVVRFLGGTVQTRNEVAAAIGRMLRHWQVHGIGLFSVVRKEDDRLLGRVGFLLWDPDRWLNALHSELNGPIETELGWTLGREFWNRGYATEAALACRDWALDELELTRLVSLIAPENTPSIRVAEKIGETLEHENLPVPFEQRVDLYSLAGNGPAR